MSRRTMLLTAASALTIPLASCDGNTDTKEIASDIDGLATGINSIVDILSSQKTIPDDKITQLKHIVAELQSIATAMKALGEPNQGKALVASAEALINQVLQIVSGLPLPSPIPILLEAISIVFPVIETKVGLPPSETANNAVQAADRAAIRPAPMLLDRQLAVTLRPGGAGPSPPAPAEPPKPAPLPPLTLAQARAALKTPVH